MPDSTKQTNQTKQNKASKLRQHGQKAKQKGLSALFKLVFSHMMVTLLLLALQIYIMYWALYRVQSQAALLALFYGLGMVAIVVLINGDDNPAFKLAWIIPICIFPVFGVALYIFISTNPEHRGTVLLCSVFFNHPSFQTGTQKNRPRVFAIVISFPISDSVLSPSL